MTLSLRTLARWRRWLLVIVLIGAAGLLDWRMLHGSTLWPDELFSLAIATGHSLEHPAAVADPARGDFIQADQPLALNDLRRSIAHENPPASLERVVRAVFLSDTSPPLYYLLLHVWTRLAGTTDTDLRAFSVLWFLASIPLILAIAYRIGGSRAELPAGLLFILAPGAVYYATEGRMYSLLWFCVLGTALLTLLLRAGKRPRLMGTLWVASSAAGLLVHYFFLFPWFAMVAFLALRPGADNFRRLVLRLTVVIGLILPWYWHLPASLQNWRITQDWLNWLPHDFSRPRAIADLALQFFSNDGHYLWWDHPTAKIFLLCTFGFLALVTAFRLRTAWFAGNRLMLWGWFAACCAGPVVFDLVKHTYTVAVPRYAISALPAAALLAALALSRFRRAARLGLLAIILTAWSYSLRSIYDNPSRNDLPFWKLGQVLSAEATESDLILVHSIPSGAVGVSRYTQGPAKIAAWVGQLGTRTTPDSLLSLAAGFRRILFVRLHDVGAPAPEEEWLRANAQVVQETRYKLILMVEFRPTGAETF